MIHYGQVSEASYEISCRVWWNGISRSIYARFYTELPRDLRLIYDQKMAKLAVTRELVGKVVWSSYATHQKVISYSWIPEIAHWNRQGPRSLLSVKEGRGTCQFHLRVTQLAAGSSFGRWSLQVGRNSLGCLVCRSAHMLQVTLEIFISCKLLPSDTGNSGRSLPGRRSVANLSQSITGPEFMPIGLRMACEGRELTSLSWCGRKSLLLLGQLCTFCLLVYQSVPETDVNASLPSDDKSLTTAHESNKCRSLQLVNRS